MECPFRELHELYKIVYERAEARAKAEEERENEEAKKREEEERAERARKGLPPILHREPPSDVKKNRPTQPILSPDEADELEEMFEDMAEGGVM